MNLPANPTPSFIRRNPHLYRQHVEKLVQAKRVRQDHKPLLNKLESEWFERIRSLYPSYPPVRAQALRYRLGNGIWYRPDFTCALWPNESGPARAIAWEVKGPYAHRGGFENLKIAASLYPEVEWVLVWKNGADWEEQIVLP